MAKVFLSSTYDDLREYRVAAQKVLSGLGHDVVGLENASATDERPSEWTFYQIAECDLFIGIVAWRYGYIPPEDNPERLSFLEIEYLQALGHKKSVLMFLHREAAAWPEQFVDADESRRLRLRGFRERLSHDRVVGFFSSVDDFVTQLTAAVAKWERDRASRTQTTVSLENLPLAWRLVVDFKAPHDLLHNLEPSVFAAAIEKWEEENVANRNLPWTERLKTVRTNLEGRQSGHEPSVLWLAWMRATRPDTAPAEVGTTEDASASPGPGGSVSADIGETPR